MAKTCACQSLCWNTSPFMHGTNELVEQVLGGSIDSSRCHASIFTPACAQCFFRFSFYGSCTFIINTSRVQRLVPSHQLFFQLMSYLAIPESSLGSSDSGLCKASQAIPHGSNPKLLLQRVSHRAVPLYKPSTPTTFHLQPICCLEQLCNNGFSISARK